MTLFSAAGLHSTEADCRSPTGRLGPGAALDGSQSHLGPEQDVCPCHRPRRGLPEASSPMGCRRTSILGSGDMAGVRFRGQSQLLSQIVTVLRQEGAFVAAGQVSIRGRSAEQWIAETEVVIDGPAWGQTPEGKTRRVPGPALRVRLVVVQVRDGEAASSWRDGYC